MFKPITFREKMNMYDKESLKMFAADLWIRKVSQLNKADLIDRITEEFLDPEKLFYRLAIFDDVAFKLIEEGSRGYVDIPVGHRLFDIACEMDEIEIASFEGERFETLSDVWETYEKEIAGDKFEAYRAKASWVWKCLRWAEYMYVFMPEYIFLKLVNTKKKMHMDVAELREIFGNFPDERVRTLRFEDAYIEKTFIHNKQAAESLRRAQANKEFYIPTADEVDEFFHTGALISKKPYQDMYKYLTQSIKIDKQEAEELLLDLWDKLTLEDDPHGAMQWFWDQFILPTEEQMRGIVSLYMPLSNSTNLLVNRGYAPADMPHPALKPGQMPTVVPGSSQAAKMLSDAMPELKKMGINVDLDSNAATVPVFGMPNGTDGPVVSTQKKIYPNDPCPCGSGKKYKKCCGLKNK